MKKSLIIVALAALSIVSCSKKQNNEDAAAPTPAQSLIARLDSLKDKGYMYGHQDDPFYGITWEWERGRSDTKELVGDYPGVMGFEIGGIEVGDLKNLDSVPFIWLKEEHTAYGDVSGEYVKAFMEKVRSARIAEGCNRYADDGKGGSK